MLSLTRHPGQKIIITHEPSGDQFVIEVQSISYKTKWVRFGIDAEKCFLIDRDEIHEAKKAEGRT